MGEIQIGEYVRTKKGTFDIVTESKANIGVVRCKRTKYWREDITKHSKNIIDLLEIGDFVNGSYIFETGNAINGEKWVHTAMGRILYNNELEKAKILTKEQYKNNCYEVGE